MGEMNHNMPHSLYKKCIVGLRRNTLWQMIAKLFIKAGVENDCYSNGKHDLNSEVQNTITISL